MKNRGRNVATRLARQRARKLRVHEALAELERAQKLSLQSVEARGHYLNDDKSPLIDLMNCIVCRETMKIEKSGVAPKLKTPIKPRGSPFPSWREPSKKKGSRLPRFGRLRFERPRTGRNC